LPSSAPPMQTEAIDHLSIEKVSYILSSIRDCVKSRNMK
jgi:hypothetical protein